LTRIRVLLADMPRLLFDLVDALISAEPDMLIAREHFQDTDLPTVVARAGADVVVVSDEKNTDSQRWISLLYNAPQIKVLVLEDAGRTAMLYELRPHRTPLGKVSMAGLVDAIRTAARGEVA
jgi:DNA-binding NarL/FixJ family response regulator